MYHVTFLVRFGGVELTCSEDENPVTNGEFSGLLVCA